MPRLPIKSLLRLATLGGAAYAVLKRRAQAPANPGPPDAPRPSAAPSPAPEPRPAPPPADTAAGSAAADPIDDLVAEEEAAAAAEAGAIGGRVRHDPEDPDMDADSLDPAMQPVYEAGGGPSEGFEAAEADLVDNASHGGGRGNPLRDAPDPEAESDLSDVEYGEADHVHPADEDREDPDDEEDER